VEKDNRKNLVGVRVLQKNLVYITGLAPTSKASDPELVELLRSPAYFGQYGNILKVSISNRKTSDGQNPSIGVYVTFERKEDARTCINAVDGWENDGRPVRAQLGTTKYCSTWLRNENCTNRGCLFLHELGDEEDSYSRHDLSSLNSIATQRPMAAGGPSRAPPRQQPTPAPPVTTQPAAAQPMIRSSSKEGSENSSMDGLNLPSSANWARNPQRSRRGSHATSGAASSPAISTSLPVTAEAVEDAIVESPVAEEPPAAEVSSSNQISKPTTYTAPKSIMELYGPEYWKKRNLSPHGPEDVLKDILRTLALCPKQIIRPVPEEELFLEHPPLFDLRGGEKRRRMREEEEARRLGVDQDEQVDTQIPLEVEPKESGSLALGGEPEDRDHGRDVHSFDQRRPGAQHPIQRTNTDGLFGSAIGSGFPPSSASIGSIGTRTMTPQQSSFMRQGSFAEPFVGISASQSSAFQQQGHNRQGSRYNWSAENSSSSSIKVAPNSRIMAQQSSMMPSFHAQASGQYYPTSMAGPPPGLKSTGTPPSAFGSGHSFGAATFGAAPKEASNEMLQLMRGRNNQSHDAGKREYSQSYFLHQLPPIASHTPTLAASHLSPLYGSELSPKHHTKRKKHRRANGSSFGGSGTVDLAADPSIVRMQQHQTQNNAGSGQGLFGGQSQGGYNPNMMYNTNYARW
jgi:CCR4-NOT transcription complex subunit 4